MSKKKEKEWKQRLTAAMNAEAEEIEKQAEPFRAVLSEEKKAEIYQRKFRRTKKPPVRQIRFRRKKRQGRKNCLPAGKLLPEKVSGASP